MSASDERAHGHLWPLSRSASPSSLYNRPIKLAGTAVLLIVLSSYLYSRFERPRVLQHSYDSPPSTVLRVAESPGRFVPLDDYRLSDIDNGFENFTRSSECALSSLDLHDPFSPLCQTRTDMLRAASEGGRAGLDAAYTARGCDFRWFTNDELCEILDRFSTIILVGDSLTRYLTIAMHAILRTDLVSGAVTGWTPEYTQLQGECTCEKPFNGGTCMWYGAWSSRIVRQNDPKSFYCQSKGITPVEYHINNKWPVEDVSGLRELIPAIKPKKPIAFIMGGGMWNSLNETETHMWLDQIEGAIRTSGPWLDPDPLHPFDSTQSNDLISNERATNLWRGRDDIVFPRLFITPSAAGGKKPEQYQDSQGNLALERFERRMGPYLQERGYDHLGIYNMTIQNTSPDGTHACMRANLLKAMIVFNWLNMIDLSSWTPGEDP